MTARTSTAETGGTIATIVALLLAIPVVTMGVVMPVMMLTGMGHAPMGHAPVDQAPIAGGGWMLLVPAILLAVFGAVGYVLYTRFDGDRGGASTDDALAALRSAYARGDLSDEEFETRRARLRAEGEIDGRSVGGAESSRRGE